MKFFQILGFWLAWLVVAGFGILIWVESACPPAACNGMLMFMQAGIVITLAIPWFLIGLYVSWRIARKKADEATG